MWTTQNQFSADQLDQLDLALDQLALRDRNFSRFGLMLVDNVVELALHAHARRVALEAESRWARPESPSVDPRLVARAQSQHFGDKVKLAEATSILKPKEAESIRILHDFRNSAYHTGNRHEGILHPVALFYFGLACDLLGQVQPPTSWSSSSTDRLPYRAKKHLGVGSSLFEASTREDFARVWVRLRQVADDMTDDLVEALASDMQSTVDDVDNALGFLSSDAFEPTTRDEAVVRVQTRTIAFSPEGDQFAQDNGCDAQTVGERLRWMEKHYPIAVPKDPIPGWRSRLERLKAEADGHTALKKYRDFMIQTETFREQVFDAAGSLDSAIQAAIDEARGK